MAKKQNRQTRAAEDAQGWYKQCVQTALEAPPRDLQEFGKKVRSLMHASYDPEWPYDATLILIRLNDDLGELLERA